MELVHLLWYATSWRVAGRASLSAKLVLPCLLAARGYQRDDAAYVCAGRARGLPVCAARRNRYCGSDRAQPDLAVECLPGRTDWAHQHCAYGSNAALGALGR